jgi:hypothetical protein
MNEPVQYAIAPLRPHQLPLRLMPHSIATPPLGETINTYSDPATFDEK